VRSRAAVTAELIQKWTIDTYSSTHWGKRERVGLVTSCMYFGSSPAAQTRGRVMEEVLFIIPQTFKAGELFKYLYLII
jgi:hypothetical protein